MKIVHTDKAPAAIGPYSQAIVVNGFVFFAGQIGIDPKTGNLVDGLEKQTNQVLSNIEAVLKAVGGNRKNIVKTTVYLKNINDFLKVNDVYASFFGSHKPARATVEVSNLPKGALIEIEAIAIK